MVLSLRNIFKEAKLIKDKNKFSFNKENQTKVKEILAKYPENCSKSAILPLFDLAQRQNNNHLSREAIEHIAELLNIAHIRAYEVASFYSMFNLEPVGKYLIQICGTTPCWLRGAENIKNACKKNLGIDLDQTTKDEMFTLKEVECLGSCATAPMVQINDDYYEDLTEESINNIIDNLKAGKKILIGSQIGRKSSEPFTK